MCEPAPGEQPAAGRQRALAGRAEIHTVPGDHLSVLLPPHVAVLAAQLRGALERAEEALPPRPELAASEGLRSLAEAP